MSNKTYAEQLVFLLKEKTCEIHTGDTKHTQQYSDYSINKKSVVRGKIIEAYGDVLVMDCITNSGETTRAYINGYAISLVTEYDGRNVSNIYLDEDKQSKV